MEARSRLDQNGTPSIMVHLNRSDLSDSSGDIVGIFLAALNSDKYRMALSIMTTHVVRWKKKSGDVEMGDYEDLVSGEQLQKMQNDPTVINLKVIRDEGMTLKFFAADAETQEELMQSNMPQNTPDTASDYHTQTVEHSSSLEGFMRPKS